MANDSLTKDFCSKTWHLVIWRENQARVSEQKNQELKMGTIITAAVLLRVDLRARAYHRKEWRPATKIYPASGISVKESRELGEVGHDFQLAAGASPRAVYRAIPRNVSAVGKCTKPKNKLVCHRLVSNNRHLRSPEVQTQHVWSKTSSLLRAPLEV